MRKLLTFAITLAVAAAVVGGYLYFSGAEYVVQIAQRDLGAAVQKRFPIEQRKAGVLKATLSDPRLKLDGGTERLYMDLAVEVDLGFASFGLGRSEQGTVTISSGLRYDPEQGRLQLDDPRMEELRVADLPEEYREPTAQVISTALAGHVNGMVVYQLSSDSYRESLARLFLKDVEIGDGALRARLGVGS